MRSQDIALAQRSMPLMVRPLQLLRRAPA